MLNNIYGVDIDANAVEVTKLSLLLKVLEHEDSETLNRQLGLWHERALPNLSGNIKCGNSLIGPDYYDNQQSALFDEEELHRVNAFDWQSEFAEVFARGGFDAVIGNPPYGASLSSSEAKYLRDLFESAEYQIDTYPLFVEKGLRILKKPSFLGFIIPSAWVLSNYNVKFRKLLVSNKIERLVITPKKTFSDAVVETLILILQKKPKEEYTIEIERWDLEQKITYQKEISEIKSNDGYGFNIYTNPHVSQILGKMQKRSNPLSKIASAVWGIKVYQKGKGKPKQKGHEAKQKIFHSKQKLKDSHRPLTCVRQ